MSAAGRLRPTVLDARDEAGDPVAGVRDDARRDSNRVSREAAEDESCDARAEETEERVESMAEVPDSSAMVRQRIPLLRRAVSSWRFSRAFSSCNASRSSSACRQQVFRGVGVSDMLGV